MANAMSTPAQRVGTRAAIYVRVSSSRQEDEGTSMVTQEQRCRAYCIAHDYRLIDGQIYREVHTGAEWRERPQLTDLRAAAKLGGIDVVVSYAVDRLSRKQAHLAIIADELEHAGIRLEFVTERFEDTAVGEFIRNAKAFAAEIEREKIAERTVRGRIERVKAGKLIPGGKPLYGYQWKDASKGQLVEDAATAPIVRRIFTGVAGGATLRQLTITLTREGVPTPTGRSRHWQTATIAAMLHKPAYKGDAYGWGIRKGGTQPQTFDPEKAIPLPAGTIPPLVDETVWDAVQTILTRNQARAVRSAKNPEAALLRGGFARCGYCSGTMYARPRVDGKVEYVCKRGSELPGTCPRPTIVAHALDAAVWGKAQRILTDPGVVAAEVEQLRVTDPTAEELRAIARAVDRVEHQQRMGAQAVTLLADADAAAPMVAQLEALAEQKRSLIHERERAEQRRESWAQTQEQLDGIERWCKTVAANLGVLTYQQKRLALDALGFSIMVYRATHDPRYVITAALGPNVASRTTWWAVW